MPLRHVFHLELARPSKITAVWDDTENRFKVVAIEGWNRLIKELVKHADEAGLSETYRSDPQFPLTPELFKHLRIEQHSTVGSNRAWGEIRLYMYKADGTHTNAWVWKDNLIWIEAKQT